MSEAVQSLIKSFDALDDNDKQLAAALVLRRAANLAGDSLSDESLVALADDLFCEWDAREASHGHS